MSDSENSPPDWDEDLYVEKFVGIIEMNTSNTVQGSTISEGSAKQILSQGLQGKYASRTVEAAVDRGLVDRTEDGRLHVAD